MPNPKSKKKKYTTRSHIRSIREAQGLTLKELADLAGTTPQTIQRLELDKLSLSVKWLDRIAPHLGVAARDLI